MTFQTDVPTHLYVAVGEFDDGTISHIGDCHTNLSDAASEYVDSMEKDYTTRVWVLDVKTAEDLTEAAKALARAWLLERDQEWPAFLFEETGKAVTS